MADYVLELLFTVFWSTLVLVVFVVIFILPIFTADQMSKPNPDKFWRRMDACYGFCLCPVRILVLILISTLILVIVLAAIFLALLGYAMKHNADETQAIVVNHETGELVTYEQTSFDIDAGATLPADRNPAIVYLASLSQGSRPAMMGALAVIAAILLGDRDDVDPTRFPWHAVRYQHAQAIRTTLADRYAQRRQQDAERPTWRYTGSLAPGADGQ